MDAVCRADGGAHHARDTFDASGGVFVESVDASEVAGFDTTFFDIEVFAPFFGVLHRVGGAALTEGGEEVTHGGAEAFEDGREVDGFHGGHGLWGHIDDLCVWDSHIRVSIAY